MKSISAAKAQMNFEKVLDLSQKERIVVTRRAKPNAMIVGIGNYDEEDLRLA